MESKKPTNPEPRNPERLGHKGRRAPDSGIRIRANAAIGVSILSLVVSILVWRFPTSPKLDLGAGGARIAGILQRVNHRYDWIARAIPDSVEAGNNRASARNVGRGSIAAYERRTALIPLRDSVEVLWSTANIGVLELLGQMGVTSIDVIVAGATVEEQLSSLEGRRDSLLSVISQSIGDRR